LRAFLTLIGIIIGVAAVIVVAASISGLKTYVVETASKVLGSNHFMMNRWLRWDECPTKTTSAAIAAIKDIKWEEYEYVRDNCRLVTRSVLRSIPGPT
jgi:ABC-type antimicrobial peptide transport system permease subunit